jgi:hypothetical protein
MVIAPHAIGYLCRAPWRLLKCREPLPALMLDSARDHTASSSPRGISNRKAMPMFSVERNPMASRIKPVSVIAAYPSMRPAWLWTEANIPALTAMKIPVNCMAEENWAEVRSQA